MPDLTFTNPTRILRSPLAAAEKRCLIWLARRTPAWINSDHLTALALGALVAAGAAFAAASVERPLVLLVLPCLALNWLGDSLDGTLARVRGHERPRYGFYVDHVLDAIGALALVAGLALSGFMTPIVALGVLAAYYLLSIEVYLATYTLGAFRLTYAGVGPTELRVLLAAGVLRLFSQTTATIAGHTWLLFDVAGAIAIGGLLIVTAIAVASHVRTLYRAEPIRCDHEGGKGIGDRGKGCLREEGSGTRYQDERIKRKTYCPLSPLPFLLQNERQAFMVLVAVDDLLFSSKIRATARQIGAEITFARSPAEILRIAREAQPPLALFDLNSAVSDPVATIGALKADPSTAGVRVVAFVSHVQTSLIDAARAAGADEVLARSAFAANLPQILHVPPRARRD